MSTETATPTGVWTIDKVHSRVNYAVEHNGAAKFRGTFTDIDASLEYSDAGVAITGSVKLDSVDLNDEQQKGHVLSPDFFDAERYPTADFKSTSVTFEDGQVVVAGQLTVRDVTKDVTIKGTIGAPGPNLGGTETIGVHLATTINRQDYGVSWSLDLPNGSAVVGNEVEIEVDLELVQG
jgi:polyisoprenoid-binding protein YceI